MTEQSRSLVLLVLVCPNEVCAFLANRGTNPFPSSCVAVTYERCDGPTGSWKFVSSQCQFPALSVDAVGGTGESIRSSATVTTSTLPDCDWLRCTQPVEPSHAKLFHET